MAHLGFGRRFTTVVVISFGWTKIVQKGQVAAEDQFASFSIVIPTYNERENAERLLGGVASVRSSLPKDLEILVVDDRSPDGTAEAMRTAAARVGLPLRVILRDGPRSLGKATVEGLEQSRGELVCVMDADLSHPPPDLARMYRALDGADGVVASRYAEGGRIEAWPTYRRLVSFGATSLAKAVVRNECTDPVSGFFLFRKSALTGIRLTGIGNKPLVEILAAKPLTIHEIAYRFRDREHGRSKLSPKGVSDFARLIAVLSARLVRAGYPDLSYEPAEASRSRDP